MLRSGDVIIALILFTFLFFLLCPNTSIFFRHTTSFFSYATRIFFKLTARFFFRFTLQICCFIFTTGFFCLGGFGHIVSLLIAHFVFFRSVTLCFITGIAFRFFCGLTFSF
ncbi:hypothetical protein D3C72_1901380 [compost metagenome]